jgi:DNA polymerase theta
MIRGSFHDQAETGKAVAPRAASFGVWRAAKGGGEKSYVKKSGLELRGTEARRAAEEEAKVMNGIPAQMPRKVLEQSMCAAILRDNTAPEIVVDPCAIASWGLPKAVLAAYEARGISRLFEWQAMCLSAKGVLNGGKNLVYNAPTSGGKTLVAEMLMLRTLVRQPGKTVLFVVPMRAIATEKVAYFRDIWGDSAHVSVQAITGDDQGALTPDLDVAVVTMEKANMILNRLLDKREDGEGVDVDLSLVVIDELHLLGDPGRGFILEILIAKLKQYFPETQVCGMSATLPNLNQVASWMKAEMFSTQVEARALNVLVCRDGVLKGATKCYKLLSDEQLQSTTSDASRATKSTVELCVNTVINKGCVLLFCPTKIWVENTSGKVAEGFRTKRIVLDKKQVDGIRALRKKLSWLRCGLCPVLDTTLNYGVAYHHSGLIPEERSLLEDAFKSGVVTVLVATTTLATGVNLPATRVIIRSTKHLTSGMFHQMCGRAGRVGLCSEKATHASDAIVIVQGDREESEAKGLYTSSIPDVESALVEARGGGMGRLVLDGVVFGNWRDLVRCSFVWHVSTFTRKQEQLIHHENEAVQNLLKRGFIEKCASGEYRITALGKACCFSGLDPLKSSTALNFLDKARKTLLLVSEFHLVFLCTPPTHSCKVDWNEYKKLSQTLFTDYPDVHRVAEHLGFREDDLSILCNKNYDARTKSDNYTFYNTFYGAIVLYGLVMERPLMLVAEDMSLSRGELSALERDASTHAAMLISFCHHLNWTALANVLVPFSKRLVKGNHTPAMYTDLLRLGIDMPVHRAKVLYHNHLYTLLDVVSVGEERVAEILKECMPFDGSDPLVRSCFLPRFLASNRSYNH